MSNKFLKKIYNDYLDLYSQLTEFEKGKIPLCAAETYVSDFVKEPLSSVFEGKYSMGNLNYDVNEDFIGGQYINNLFKLIAKACEEIFSSKYADARTLSGMNCMSVTISALLKPNSRVLLTTGEQGGHPSIRILLSLANISIDSVPYNYDTNDINYDELNKLLKTNNYSAIIFAQSDLLQPADISRIDISNELIIYDATQTFGMIAAGIHPNPLTTNKKCVLIGGTHKTLPGPTCGLILTNAEDLIDDLDYKISPSYLRNVQPNAIASLLLALLEQKQFGKEYQESVIKNGNYLAQKLEEKGLNVGKISSTKFTNTHQIFIYTSEEKMKVFYKNARDYGITLNKKEKTLFRGFGIRVGLQEVSRYGWFEKDFDLLADLLFEISQDKPNDTLVRNIIETLIQNKTNKYVFDDTFKE